MKLYNLRKKKAFPLATPLKKGNQQWNPMRRLSMEEKRYFKNKYRFFSMEYGRSLPKQLLWQIAVSKQEVYNGTTPAGVSISTGAFSQVHLKENRRGAQSAPPPVAPFQQSWAIFRSVFFGKMWMLHNPSLVPGLVWPVKGKKFYLAKLRAWKAMSQLVGKPSQHFLKKNLQKLWNLPSYLTPPLWSVAAGLDSLKTNVVLKSGFVGSLMCANHMVSRGHSSLNGNPSPKSLGFNYPGDYISLPIPGQNSRQTLMGVPHTNAIVSAQNNNLLKPANLFSSQGPGDGWVLSKLFTHGPAHPFNRTTPIQATYPFLWTSSFYLKGKMQNLGSKRTLKKRFSYKKRSAPR